MKTICFIMVFIVGTFLIGCVSTIIGIEWEEYKYRKKIEDQEKKRKEKQQKVFCDLIDQTQFNSEVHDEQNKK